MISSIQENSDREASIVSPMFVPGWSGEKSRDQATVNRMETVLTYGPEEHKAAVELLETLNKWDKERQELAQQYDEDFSGGAKRSERKPRYDLITREFLQGIAGTLALGAARYGPENWRLGDQDFAVDAYNHVLDHLFTFIAGDRSEDHLSHAAVGIMFLQYFHNRHPEWFKIS